MSNEKWARPTDPFGKVPPAKQKPIQKVLRIQRDPYGSLCVL